MTTNSFKPEVLVEQTATYTNVAIRGDGSSATFTPTSHTATVTVSGNAVTAVTIT